jgi:feruloyl esterase
MDGAEAVSNFYRLFLVPGFDHCGLQSGVGISQSGLDPLSALENWVEKGVAPDPLAEAERSLRELVQAAGDKQSARRARASTNGSGNGADSHTGSGQTPAPSSSE